MCSKYEKLASIGTRYTYSGEAGSESPSEDGEESVTFEDVPLVGSLAAEPHQDRPKDPRSKAKYNLLSRLLFWYRTSLAECSNVLVNVQINLATIDFNVLWCMN